MLSDGNEEAKNQRKSIKQNGLSDENEILILTKFIEEQTSSLANVKRLLDKYPLEGKDDAYDPSLLFKLKNYVDILPAFIKAVDFTDFKQTNTCYQYLDKSEKARRVKPEEARALLDS